MTPRLVITIDRSILVAPVPADALSAWYLGMFGASSNDWRLAAWQLLHDHFDRWSVSRLWRRAPHVRFAALSPERQALVALQLLEGALRRLAETPIAHPGEATPRPPAPALLPWITDRHRSLRAQLIEHEHAVRAWRRRASPLHQLIAAGEAARALRETRRPDIPQQEN